MGYDTKKLSSSGSLDDLVQYATIHIPLPVALSGSVMPFMLIYALWLYLWVFVYGIDEYRDAGLLFLAGIGFTQILVCLCCFWSVHVQTFLNCRKTKAPCAGAIVKVVPTENNGASELVRIHQAKRETDVDFKGDDNEPQYWFLFQKAKYFWDPNKALFRSVDFPIHNTYEEYYESKGHLEDADVALAQATYGDNEMEMVVPEFFELFKERATAPFFVFQIFSVLLWCLDEYMYYSLFTLCMLVIFECVLVQQQLRSLSEIRKMGNKPYPINVFRNRRWRPISSAKLVPGDLVSVTRSQDENLVPCDLLLIRGSCIVDESMLTGESVPQMKESLENNTDEHDKVLDIEADGKLHVLFRGTKVVQHSAPSKSAMRSPDNGCIGYVLRTGFNTSQGKLLRTILFGVKRVTENNLETFAFILFLLVFAIAAAAYVWIKGTEDPERNRYKLFLECTLILTSIIPPDLPIELSLAVNTSLLQLAKVFVYCTEPFRMPFAGKVQICCFDKTGTLTSDNLVVEGIAGLKADTSIVPIGDIPEPTAHVLGSCHSLVQLDEGLVGDPLEKATLTAIEWNLTKGESVVPKRGKFKALRIYHRFHFSSSLKRMSVLAGYLIPFTNDTCYIGTVKGAPEVIVKMLKHVPEHYERTYLEYSRRGARVLALGYKSFGTLDTNTVRELKRDDVERDLEFAGFIIISCPLKPDSKYAIKEIIQASHKVMMITGDNPLTACHVAKELRFSRRTIVILTPPEETSNGNKAVTTEWHWESINQDVQVPVDGQTVKELYREYDFCITGEGLQYLDRERNAYLQQLIPYATVFARFAPKQKEYVITTLKKLGYYTLMCGDGTNDVGALKHAHVGVSLLSHMPSRSKKVQQQDEKDEKKKAIKGPSAGSGTVGTDEASRKQLTPRERAIMRARENQSAAQERLQKALKEMDEDQVQIVKLGDASIAAPFTSRLSSINCVCHIIKQGRCTLVTTLQMFKILALNALISAYCQSVLYIDGVKHSDTQLTLHGLLTAASFLFITRSKPLKVLSKQAPLPNIFNLYSVTTILAQFAVHFSALIYLVHEATERSPPREGKVKLNVDLAPDEKQEFEPNIINSTVYIIGIAMQIATVAVNYKGHPFMESLRENRLLSYAIFSSSAIVFCLALGIVPDLLSTFEVIDFEPDYRRILVTVLVADLLLAFFVDRVCSFLFGETRRKTDIIT
ncbi:endoplasmic reticulum transmembrane helix translocase [Anopheles ziemanni]|uniref:endoplasmic reticulum transmembrane helix translocase n=1 Tax=Anopheles coustani TaxID=139045 RepID=UPI00265997BB|nr:endoplasmic reticulum transmembrane helix translocase [Anopheles coustani]XP_058167014.1 endoplasmic reticulum transmembrane helix translocase [Anopheles ziemanni]